MKITPGPEVAVSKEIGPPGLPVVVHEEEPVPYPCPCGGALEFPPGGALAHTEPACAAFRNLDHGALIAYLVDTHLSCRSFCGRGCGRPASAVLRCPMGCDISIARCLEHGGFTGVGEALDAHVAACHRGT